jgi:hypothetical protein
MATKTKKQQPKMKVRDLHARKNPKGSGTVKFTDIQISKQYDKSSP